MIGICMLAWNQCEYTSQAVDSMIQHSAGHDLMFFFVNNGSSDRTQAYFESVHQKKRIIHNHENTGVTHGWNQALGAALETGCEYIVLANNDILAGPGWLEAAVRQLSKKDLRYFLPNGDFKLDHFDEDAAGRFKSEAWKTVPGRAGWCMYFRAETVRLFHPIPETMRLWYGDDYIHWVLAEKNGYTCETLLDSSVYHYISKSFYAYKGYVEQVALDKIEFEKIIGRPF